MLRSGGRTAWRVGGPAAARPSGSRGDGRPAGPPRPARLEAETPRYRGVVEARRSERVYGDRPIDARQLGEFLYRVAAHPPGAGDRAGDAARADADGHGVAALSVGRVAV